MTAFITGASSGLGEDFAWQLAAQGADLVLVACSAEKLKTLAAALEQRSKLQVTAIPADLSSAEEVSRLVTEVKSRGLKIHLLINNAGFGLFENFLDTPLQAQMEQLDVNVRALVTLTHAFTPDVIAAERGGVINIASTAAFQPLAGADIYAATKAFVRLFSEGLSLELEKTGVRVLASCPGPVATQFFANMNPRLQAHEMDQPATVVRDTLRAFEKGKRVAYPGKLLVRLSTWGARLMPRDMILRVAARTRQKPQPKVRFGSRLNTYRCFSYTRPPGLSLWPPELSLSIVTARL